MTLLPNIGLYFNPNDSQKTKKKVTGVLDAFVTRNRKHSKKSQEKGKKQSGENEMFTKKKKKIIVRVGGGKRARVDMVGKKSKDNKVQRGRGEKKRSM